MKRLLLQMLPLLLVTPAFAGDLGPADLTQGEIDNYHQNFVKFDAQCGYGAIPKQQCILLISPTRLYVDDKSILISQIKDVFEGVDDLTGSRFRHLSKGLKRRGGGGGLIGLYYKSSNGKTNLSGFGFEKWGCMQAFNVTLKFVRSGGLIPMEKAIFNSPCSTSKDNSQIPNTYR